MRAQLRAKLKMWKEAETDLDTIIEQNDPPLRALFLRSKVRMALGKKTAADADFAEGLKQEPLSAIDAIARGTARMAFDSKAALEDFKIAEKLDPRNLAVLEHRAYLEAELMHRPELAVATLGRLIERNPNSPAIRISRAVYLARVGNVKEAIAEAKKALELSDSPGVKYRVACVFALATPSDPKLAPAAMNYLFQSLKAGFGFEYLADDADLNALRQRPDFSRLAELAKLLQSAGAAK
jgi:tetratricopeptide (TPR) repeat protein